MGVPLDPAEGFVARSDPGVPIEGGDVAKGTGGEPIGGEDQYVENPVVSQRKEAQRQNVASFYQADRETEARLAGYDWGEINAHVAQSTQVAHEAGYSQPEIDRHLGFTDPQVTSDN